MLLANLSLYVGSPFDSSSLIMLLFKINVLSPLLLDRLSHDFGLAPVNSSVDLIANVRLGSLCGGEKTSG